jgi:hypothetical protein
MRAWLMAMMVVPAAPSASVDCFAWLANDGV